MKVVVAHPVDLRLAGTLFIVGASADGEHVFALIRIIDELATARDLATFHRGLPAEPRLDLPAWPETALRSWRMATGAVEALTAQGFVAWLSSVVEHTAAPAGARSWALEVREAAAAKGAAIVREAHSATKH